MNKQPIYAFHAPSKDFTFERESETYLQIWFDVSLAVDVVWLRSEPDNEEHLSTAQYVFSNDVWHIWEAKLERDYSKEITHYCFMFVANKRTYYLDAANVSVIRPPKDMQFKINFVNQPPEWVCQQNFYQIFPDRFCNGDPSISVQAGELPNKTGQGAKLQQWGEKPNKAWAGYSFFGGDLAGIEQNTAYLKESGFTTLYLTPIFTSRSNHKYDTDDYFQVDPHFGTNAQFAAFVGALHNQGMRIILDAVVNHTSVFHHWFDYANTFETVGAYQSPHSDYIDFYTITHTPKSVDYLSWNSSKTLPKLDYAAPALHDLVYKNEDSILQYWLRPPYQIDGWRMDVIQMIGDSGTAKNNHSIVKGMREAVKSANKEAYFLGEHFAEATSWLQGEQEDGAMNYYGFKQPVINFLKPVRFGDKIDASALDEWLKMSRAKIPFENQLAQFNLLGSHDTERFLHVMKGDETKMQMGFVFLFTYIGVPCVYYGDEIGLTGAGDPDNRRCFDWDTSHWNQAIKTVQTTLAHFRLSRKELQRGACVTLYAKNRVYIYARVLSGAVTIIAINDGREKTVDIPCKYAGLFTAALQPLWGEAVVMVEGGMITHTLPAKSSHVWFTP